MGLLAWALVCWCSQRGLRRARRGCVWLEGLRDVSDEAASEHPSMENRACFADHYR